MKNQDYNTSLLVDESPEHVFAAIINPRGWWSEEIDGVTDKEGSEFLYHYKDVHIARIKIEEFVPHGKVVWLVKNNHFNFTKDKTEWTGTRIRFDISVKDRKTKLTFTHEGLVPFYECYKICEEAWGNYIHNSLKSLITTGTGEPNQKDGEGFNAKIVEKWKLGQHL